MLDHIGEVYLASFKVNSRNSSCALDECMVRITQTSVRVEKDQVTLFIPASSITSTGKNAKTVILFLRGQENQANFEQQEEEVEQDIESQQCNTNTNSNKLDDCLFEMMSKACKNPSIKFTNSIRGNFIIQLDLANVEMALKLNESVIDIIRKAEQNRQVQDHVISMEEEMEDEDIQEIEYIQEIENIDDKDKEQKMGEQQVLKK